MNQSKYAHSRLDVHYPPPYDVYDKEPLPETNKESDLTWLARNVHEWEESAKAVMRDVNLVKWLTTQEIDHSTACYFYTEWLEERARLQNKPSWDDAPEWANWLAQDKDGDWFFHEDEPHVESIGYWWSAASEVMLPKGEVLGDYRNTLEKRPEPLEIPDGASCKELEYENYAALKYSDEPVMIPAASVFKQERYKDHNGEDWIDECARTFTTEEFRGAMKFNIGKYNRRAGKKDALIKEITKIEDYARRWRLYEEAKEMD